MILVSMHDCSFFRIQKHIYFMQAVYDKIEYTHMNQFEYCSYVKYQVSINCQFFKI